jgi:hypothetical protein
VTDGIRLVGGRAAAFVLLAGFAGLLGGCSGMKPAPLITPPSEMSNDQPGLISGPTGEIVIYERK